MISLEHRNLPPGSSLPLPSEECNESPCVEESSSCSWQNRSSLHRDGQEDSIAMVSSLSSYSDCSSDHCYIHYSPSEDFDYLQKESIQTQHHDRNEYVVTSVHPELQSIKNHRRHTALKCGTGGAVLGTILLPIIGTIVGGALSGYSAHLVLKKREKRLQRKWERDQFQKQAQASQAAKAVFV